MPTGSPHKAATQGSIGHVITEKLRIEDLGGRSVAELADRVLSALTAAMSLLKEQDAARPTASAAPSWSPSKRRPRPARAGRPPPGGDDPQDHRRHRRRLTGHGGRNSSNRPSTAQGCYPTSFTEVGPNCLALAYSGIVMGLSNRKNDWFVPTVNSMYTPVVASKP